MFKRLLLLGAGILIGLLVTGLIILVSNPNNGTPIYLLPTNTLGNLTIYVGGGVTSPGVYSFSPGARVIDVIKTAGGFSPDAVTDQVNLSKTIYDEQFIYIPRINNIENSSSADLTTSTLPVTKINLNIATFEELVLLPGIGPSKAEDIIRFRDENGPFSVINDLLQVPGIGQKTLDNLLEYIFVE